MYESDLPCLRAGVGVSRWPASFCGEDAGAAQVGRVWPWMVLELAVTGGMETIPCHPVQARIFRVHCRPDRPAIVSPRHHGIFPAPVSFRRPLRHTRGRHGIALARPCIFWSRLPRAVALLDAVTFLPYPLASSSTPSCGWIQISRSPTPEGARCVSPILHHRRGRGALAFRCPTGVDRPRRRSEILPPLVPTLSTDCRLKSPSMSPFRLPFAPFGILVRPVSIPSVSSPFGGGFSRPSCLVLSNPHVPPSQHHTNAVQTSTTHVLEGASIPHARTAATSQDKGGTHLLWQGRNWPEAGAQEGPATRGFDGTRTRSQVAYEENDRIHGQSMLEGVQRGGACVTLRDWTGKETCDGEGRLRSHGTVLESIRLGSSFFRFRS